MNVTTDKTAQLQQLLPMLHLVRIGIYPTDGISEQYAVFDLTINRKVTDQLIVIYTKENGKIIEVTNES